MEPCLIDNKVCSASNMRCKVCKLNSSEEVIKMIETHEQRIRKIQEENIRKQLPVQCRKCGFLQFISFRDKKLYCPYMIKDCVIRGF